jgi:hypothetical protein
MHEKICLNWQKYFYMFYRNNCISRRSVSSEGIGNFAKGYDICWNKNLLMTAMLSYKKIRKMIRNIGDKKTL